MRNSDRERLLRICWRRAMFDLCCQSLCHKTPHAEFTRTAKYRDLVRRSQTKRLALTQRLCMDALFQTRCSPWTPPTPCQLTLRRIAARHSQIANVCCSSDSHA